MKVLLYLNQIEEEVAARPHLMIDARRTLRFVLRSLVKRAQPGNWAWWQLVNEYGWQADYSPADHGEPPAGSKW